MKKAVPHLYMSHFPRIFTLKPVSPAPEQIRKSHRQLKEGEEKKKKEHKRPHLSKEYMIAEPRKGEVDVPVPAFSFCSHDKTMAEIILEKKWFPTSRAVIRVSQDRSQDHGGMLQ